MASGADELGGGARRKTSSLGRLLTYRDPDIVWGTGTAEGQEAVGSRSNTRKAMEGTLVHKYEIGGVDVGSIPTASRQFNGEIHMRPAGFWDSINGDGAKVHDYNK